MQTLTKMTKKLTVLLILFLVLSTWACAPTATTPAVTDEPVVEELPSPTEPPMTPTPDVPTATPEPAAALVNGETVPLALFEGEVERYLLAQSAMGKAEVDVAAAREIVLLDLIDQVLLAQAARDAGAHFSDDQVQARIDDLAGEVNLTAWMAEWGYTLEALQDALRLQMLVAYQRDEIAATIPETVEQVELQQVFAFTEAGASRALRNLNAGAAFEDIAFEFSPETGGYLGWIPRGYLLFAEVEEAAFNTPVGSYTDIIESEVGYHILLVIDRENRPLSSDARLALERLALHAWLEAQRAGSIIEVLVD